MTVRRALLALLPALLLAACAPPAAAAFAIYAGSEPRGEPVISAADIASYNQATHEITLTQAAAERIGKLQVPTSGLPFVACVGSEPIYQGAFWTSVSSQSYDGLTIDVTQAASGSVRIQLAYPESPGRFKGEDRRADPKIMRALSQAGKLE